jgi:hypothetical protein
MDLPKNEAVFDLDHTGDVTGKRYEGQFKVLCVLNMAQKHSMELEKTRLMGNFANPTDGLAGIAVILSTLRAKIVDAPEWWKQSGGGYDIMDEDALVAVYNKIMAAEAEWRTNLKEKGKKAQEKTQDKSSTPSTP